MIKSMLGIDLYKACDEALNLARPGKLIAPRLTIGDMVTFADPKLPGLWVYAGDSFMRPEVWNQSKPLIDYGIRPMR